MLKTNRLLKSSSGLPRSRSFRLLRGGALLLSMLWPMAAHATDGTWLSAPGTDVWNTGANWSSSPTVPDGTASFDASTQKSIEFSAATTSIGGLTFNAAAPAYAFLITPNANFGTGHQLLEITGAGIVNHSAFSPVFNVGADLASQDSYVSFHNSSTASNATFKGTGSIVFLDTSTAGHASITIGYPGGVGLVFESQSTAANAAITNNVGSTISFLDSSTAGNASITNDNESFLSFNSIGAAGNATITNSNGATVEFQDFSNAGMAAITNNSGSTISFTFGSTGDGATIINNTTAKVDISDYHEGGFPVGIGSLSGAGNVFLGSRNLTLGGLSQNETISGVIANGGVYGGTAGSLTKIGTGILSLTNANTYSCGTSINGGTLIATHDGALGGGNVSLTASGATLTLQNGATNNYIANAASLSVVSGSTVNLNFTGTPDTIGSLIVDGVAQAPGLYGSAASGAPNQLPEFTGTGQVLVTPVSQLLNISTRMRVLTADKVLIGGFIITGCDAKKVIIRGIGPSLNGVGVTLSDPTLELHQGSTTLATNDNWKIDDQTGLSQQAEIEATTIPPKNDLESAIVMTLSPGAYTAILAGKSGGTGVGLVEVYDLDQAANSKLANISTRGFVDTGNNVMIGGLIVGNGSGGMAQVVVRALGPSLSGAGVAGALADPTLELHDGSGTTLATNDNWKVNDQTGQSQQAEIEATTIPPTNDLESALVATLAPGNYTAIVRGKNNTTGVGLVEVYNLQ